MSDAPADATLPRQILPGLTVAFLFFAPQLAALEASRNRYFLFWGAADTLSLCVAVLLVAAVGLSVGGLIDRRGGPGLRAAKDQAFVILFLLAAAVNLPRLASAPFMLGILHPHRDAAIVVLQSLLALLAGMWLWLQLFRRPLLIRAARTACLILSPLVPIVIGQTFFFERYAMRQDPIPAAAADRSAGGTPIIFVVFDEWSYEASTADEDFLADLPALRALRAESFFFTRAESPATTTYISLPRLLFQTDDYRSLPGVMYSWRDFPGELGLREEFVTPAAEPGRAPESLFAAPRRAGYKACLLGFYLPYRLILGDQVDMVRSYSDYPRGDGFAERFLMNVAQTPQYWRLPGISALWKRAYALVFSRHWLRLNERLLADFEMLAGRISSRSIVFLHYPVPHAPFIYDAGGAYRGPFMINSRLSEDIDVDIMGGTPDDYHQSLGHLDRVVGRMVARLRETGRYDDALVIMTSDHAWRNDPALQHETNDSRVRHVPLLVKAPGQTSPRTITDPVALSRIAPLLEAAARGGLDVNETARLIAAIAHGAP
jgi:hypothetical protein